jgi:hypothetical protein
MGDGLDRYEPRQVDQLDHLLETQRLHVTRVVSILELGTSEGTHL